jgi:hypothetical protein
MTFYVDGCTGKKCQERGQLVIMNFSVVLKLVNKTLGVNVSVGI